MQSYNVIDCFCGAGGLSLGFHKAGFRVLYAFDNDPASVETHNLNFEHQAFVRDVRNVSISSIRDDLGGFLPVIDGILGGPPCQGFSVQRRGSDYDPRNNLVLEFVRLVTEMRPRFFLMENVQGLLSKRGREVMGLLEKNLIAAGYEFDKATLDTYDFGVPQHRKRVLIAGSREKTLSPLVSLFAPARREKDPKTVRDAIGDLADKPLDSLANHKADRLSPLNLERIRAVKAGQGRDSLPEHLRLTCHRENFSHRHLDVYGRMAWDEPSPTITARFDSFSRGRFGHPELDRTVTLREGARLQSFPDEFEFKGSKVEVARQIGNAVPPRFAEALALAIKMELEKGHP